MCFIHVRGPVGGMFIQMEGVKKMKRKTGEIIFSHGWIFSIMTILVLIYPSVFMNTIKGEEDVRSLLPYRNIEIDEYELYNSYGDWSPDGQKIAFTAGCALRIWDVNNNNYILEREDYPQSFYRISWSPNGTYLLAGTTNNTAVIFDPTTGDVIRTFTGHTYSVYVVDWSPDGSMICTGSDDGDVRIWNASTGQCVQILSGHGGWINDIDWSPSSDRILSCSLDKVVRMWDASNGEILFQTPTQSGIVVGVCWHPNNDEFFTGSGNKYLIKWTKENDTYNPTYMGSYDDFMPINCIEISPDGGTIAVGNCGIGENGIVDIWDIETKEFITELVGHTDSIKSIGWSPNGDRIVTCSDRSARIWDHGTWDLVNRIGNPEKVLLKWSLDDGNLFIVSVGDTLYKWNVDDDIYESIDLPFFPLHHFWNEQKVDLSSNCEIIASILNDGSIGVYKIGSLASEVKVFNVPDDRAYEHIQWAKRSNLIAAWDNHRIEILNATDMTIQNTIDVNFSGMISGLEWLPDDTGICLMPTGGDQGNSFMIFDANTGEETMKINGYFGYLNAHSISYDGRYLSNLWIHSGTDTIYTISTWDLTDGKMVGNFSVGDSPHPGIKWCPSEYTLAVDSWDDHCIMIVDPFTGEILMNLSREVNGQYYLGDIKWSHDGSKLGAFSMKDVNIWDFSDTDDDRDGTEEKGMKTSTIIIIVGAIVLILIVILVIVFIFLKKKSKPDERPVGDPVEPTEEVEGKTHQIAQGNNGSPNTYNQQVIYPPNVSSVVSSNPLYGSSSTFLDYAVDVSNKTNIESDNPTDNT